MSAFNVPAFHDAMLELGSVAAGGTAKPHDRLIAEAAAVHIPTWSNERAWIGVNMSARSKRFAKEAV